MRITTWLFSLLLLSVAGCSQPKASQTDSPESLIRHGAPLVDVRSSREYQISHVQGSTNLPIDELERRIGEVAPDKKAPVLVHCQSGGRSAAAAQKLQSMGYKQVVDLGSLANARKVVEGQ
jgi:rhodanese-related sulfurtransferase